MKRRSILLGLAMLSFTVVYMSCIHEIPVQPNTGGNNGGVTTPPPAANGSTCSKDTVYYANDIQPLLNSSCGMSGCHDAVTHKEGVNVTSYANVMRMVSAGNANNSKLYDVITNTGGDRMPPPPMSPLTADQILKIKTWINQGAKNNSCTSCDTSDFKFSTAVQPMIANYCQGCHNTGNASGGYDLSTYAGIKSAAASGVLYNSIIWASGFSPMPKGGSKLSECQLQKVKKWIDAGTPKN
ncbi:c-type cytochrome [Flavihumibacter profundi]|jgi:hypothetical protein|uniref:c-type cytochrome n=1 Tax=Flavihumibacter profundi TaxID=2716883 RepID=UPI001CC524BA|nr:cytochrome c [Flavihumibacter profundi]MBZ5858686.1 cytochrome c [Flavihumibacter profundi]